jgi:hypothetical protein
MIDGITKKHFIYSLNVDTGATNAGWPVDVGATATYNGISFNSSFQNERGGLALVNGRVYVSYSGHAGDCNPYHGWVVGVDINNPSDVHAWATTALSRETPLTRVAIGWGAKPLFGCKPARSGPVSLPTIGRLLIGSHSTTPTRISVV